MKRTTATYGARMFGSVFKMEFRDLAKGQIKPKADWRAVDSSKIREHWDFTKNNYIA